MTNQTVNPNNQTRSTPHWSLDIGHWAFFRHWSLDIRHSRRCLAAFLTLLLPSIALAHPLGNESINHIAILWVLPDRVEFDLFLDFAEGPSQRYPHEIDADRDGEETAEEQKAWLMRKARECIPFLTVTIDGRPVPLTVPEQARNPNTGREMPLPGMVKAAGEAGAPVYRTLFRYVGRFPEPLSPGEHVVTYEDITFGQYNGLKRIVLENVPSVEIVESTPPLDFLDPEAQVFFYDQYDPANLPQEKRATIKFVVKSEVSPRSETASQSEESLQSEKSQKSKIDLESEIHPKSEIDLKSEISNLKSSVSDGQSTPGTTQPSPSSTTGTTQPSPSSATDTTHPSLPSATGTAQLSSSPERSAAQPTPPSQTAAAQLSSPSPEGTKGNIETQAASGLTGPQDFPYPILDPRNDPAQMSESSRQARQLISLLQGRWGFMVFLTVTALSFVWGAAHALMPGHAKTVVAAYLISRSGNYWHAVVLAVIVTVTHTALVVALGLIIWFYQATHPTLGARLQLWLGLIAGLLVAGMGLLLLWRALTGRIAHHHHEHDHHHSHEHDHDHGHRSWLRMLFTHSHPHVPEVGARDEGRGTRDEGSGFGQGGQGDTGTRRQGDIGSRG
ncbi:MAG: hypothetical protein GXW89_08840, partial [Phycisphaerae bacterium]|nr:hypothetical protein [Phycisphaerae bacterium]